MQSILAIVSYSWLANMIYKVKPSPQIILQLLEIHRCPNHKWESLNHFSFSIIDHIKSVKMVESSQHLKVLMKWNFSNLSSCINLVNAFVKYVNLRWNKSILELFIFWKIQVALGCIMFYTTSGNLLLCLLSDILGHQSLHFF